MKQSILLLGLPLLLTACGGGSGAPISTAPPTGPSSGLQFAEGNINLQESSGAFAVRVRIAEALGEDLVVGLSAGGSATANVDYQLESTTITIAAGALEGQTSLTPLADGLIEETEIILLGITGSTPSGLVDVGSTNQLAVALFDDDSSPVVSFGQSSASGAETGGAIHIPLTLSAVAFGDVTVPILLSGDADASDYSLEQNPVLIPAGSLSADVVILPVDDGVAEGNEFILLTLDTPTGADVGSPSTATVTLTDEASGGGGNWGNVLFNDFSDSLGQPGVYSTNLPPTSPQALTTNGLTPSYTLSPSGTRISYLGLNSQGLFPYPEAYVLDEATGTERPVSSGLFPDPVYMPWSADETAIAVIGNPTASPDEEELFLCATDGSGSIQVTGPGLLFEEEVGDRFTWSPLGDRLAFLAREPGSSLLGLYTIRKDGSGLAEVSAGFQVNVAGFRWSPNGNRLAFDTGPHLYIAEATGAGLFEVDSSVLPGDLEDPDYVWTPASDQLVYRREGSLSLLAQIYKVSASGSPAVRVSTLEMQTSLPWALAPDGNRIAYVANEDGQSGNELFVEGVAGTLFLRVSQSLPPADWVEDFWWSPNSSALAFCVDFGSLKDLFTVRADGSGLVSIAEVDDSGDFSPVQQVTWSPDSQHVAYIGRRPGLAPGTLESGLNTNAADGNALTLQAGPYPSTETVLDFQWTSDSTGLVFRQVNLGSVFGSLRGLAIDGSIPATDLIGPPPGAFLNIFQYDVR